MNSLAVFQTSCRASTLTYQLVVLRVQEVTFSQYLAPLTVADAFMAANLTEDTALRTHEYVECQEERKRALILSEFTGTYNYSGFRSCFAVNPYDTRRTPKAMRRWHRSGEMRTFPTL
ncbi:hypothetical protein EV401DRAFT_1908639 [Pisolithus croceorrhizus]|nr:hypothetical protein EV401DRAFT_1908639 [Pisolithus croceorrhizus]